MTIRLKGSYSVSAAENPTQSLAASFKPLTCNVVFLDDKSELFKVDKHCRGQLLLDLVFDFLELLERDFFGLQFSDYSCDPGPLLRWLDPTKSLKKQLKGASSHTLWLRVKFYVPDPSWLQEEFTRYLVYLQVRKDILNGSLVAPLPILAKLGGLCLQSELGDYSTDENKPGYITHFQLIPNQNSDYEVLALEAHKLYRSYVPASVELEFLSIARRLDLYGIHPHEVLDAGGNLLTIGVSAPGVSLFRDMRRTLLYVWDNIEKISFNRKTFTVRLKVPVTTSQHRLDKNSNLELPTSDRLNADMKFIKSPSYTFDSAKRAKVFWQYACTCHTFFRVKEPTTVLGSSGGLLSNSSASNGNASTGFGRPSAISATAVYVNCQPTSGISKFFFRARNHRSVSLSSPSQGLERTMSTLFNLRRRPKTVERGFSRGASRRFSRRRSTQVLGSASSLTFLNAYESIQDIEQQAVGPLIDTPIKRPDDLAICPKVIIKGEDIRRSRNSLVSSPSPVKAVRGLVSIESEKVFPRRFRSSAPPASRIKRHELHTDSNRLETIVAAESKSILNAQSKSESTTPDNASNETKPPISSNISQQITGVDANNLLNRRKCDFLSRKPVVHARDGLSRASLSQSSSQTAVNGINPKVYTACSDLSPQHDASVDRHSRSRRSTDSVCSKNDVITPEAEVKRTIFSSVTSLEGSMNGTGGGGSDDGLVVVRIKPNAKGQFGFNIKGGSDHFSPVIVSRVADDMPAGTCLPRLNAGDQIFYINGRDISLHTHQQVVNSIRAATEDHSGTLELIVRPSVYMADAMMEELDGCHLPDTGDAPPIPPKNAFEWNSIKREPSPTTWIPSSAPSVDGLRPYNLLSPRLPGSATMQVLSSKHNGRKSLMSDKGRLQRSIQMIESSLTDGRIVSQFEKLDRRKMSATMLDAKKYENLQKNRYRDISPYDQTRVRIKGISGDYINASFINMELTKNPYPKNYIAAQGPLPNTCIDFWQMIWEQDAQLIVMLTSLKEHGREKCHKYWPDLNQTFEFTWIQPRSHSSFSKSGGKRYQLRIANVQEESDSLTANRTLKISRAVVGGALELVPNSPLTVNRPRVLAGAVFENGCEVRRVNQLQFISWPDHGVPQQTSDLISFVQNFRELRSESRIPMVVHCSAGIGRTGVVILLDAAMDLIRAGVPVFPLELVQQMREYREMLIQTSAQFIFVCEAIVKYYNDNVIRSLRN